MKTFLFLFTLSTLASAGPIQLTEPELQPMHKMRVKLQSLSIKRQVRWGGLKALARYSDDALDGIVHKALDEAIFKGDVVWAHQKAIEWEHTYRGWLSGPMRDIGDHKPLIEWLATFYDHIETLLGVALCKDLHLSDIKTFNFCIPVVFKPCTFDMGTVPGTREAEWLRHFDQGAVYYGLLPVVVYWTVNIACTVATEGGGVEWLCGPMASFGEWFTGTFSGGLGAFIYRHACP